MISIIIIVCVGLASWILCHFLINPNSKIYIVDNPNYRSLHTVPKPRTGGIAIVTSILVSWPIIFFINDMDLLNYTIIISIFLLASISYIDDYKSVSQLWRLIIHFLAGYIIVINGLGLSSDMFIHLSSGMLGIVLDILSILVVVWSINLYNFMDGMDGLAGGMGVIGFGTIAIFGFMSSEYSFCLLACVVMSANTGFLVHNFPPAKIFMGDIGSITMGFLLVYFSLWGIKIDVFDWWAPLLIFSPFIVDASVTLIKRLCSGEKIWKAHKTHYYQALAQIGWGHKKTVIYEYILMSLVSISAVIIQSIGNNILIILILVLWALIFILLAFKIQKLKNIAGIEI